MASGGLNEAQLRNKFADRPKLANMFADAYRAINEAIIKLKGAHKNIFHPIDDIWISCEILDTNNPNTLHYENKNIVLHRVGFSAIIIFKKNVIFCLKK